MHSRLSKPPVKYVLMQVKFTSIENIEIYISRLQDDIRDIFPHFEKFNNQAISFRLGQQPTVLTVTQWHFIDKDKTTGIILDKQSITLHTSDHKSFSTLLASFEKLLKRFHKILNISIFTRLGLRYINLIDDGLAKVDVALQGFQLMGDDFKQGQGFTKAQTTQVSQVGVVNVMAARVGEKQAISNVTNIFVPPELVDIANVLSFKHHKEPQNGFLLLDIDHSSGEECAFNLPSILNNIKRLHGILYHVFCKAVGKENLNSWK